MTIHQKIIYLLQRHQTDGDSIEWSTDTIADMLNMEPDIVKKEISWMKRMGFLTERIVHQRSQWFLAENYRVR